MSSEIVFSPQALSDLDEIWEYIDKRLLNRNAANRTVNGIIEQIMTLEEFPELGTLLYRYIGIGNRCRFLVCGNYLAFYRFEGRVYVDRVLYKRENYMSVLFPEQIFEDSDTDH